MAYSAPPQLPPHLSHSPLLSPTHSDDVLAAFAKHFSSPILSFATPKQNLHTKLPKPRSAPQPTLRKEEPRPSFPTSNLSPPPSKQVIALLNLLDTIDNDMTAEVQRVKESIKETQALVMLYRQERSARARIGKEKSAKEFHDTKQIDSDFWAGI
ncbi:hypothetical protein JAAARDRAFT_193877 [Jaapia argillacea MUCL 33604]|uniref:Uncharacterized protein n=1 Tax=Jaapia argillacea MUCL 33604 TaxID=933084 RepID=A0A067PRX6_9AGAM|nr:hypothetical protein JAAARDRAFT_193877 [Jaapia argillacea MUCL 33604]